jgi:hypothetical protein
MKTILKLSQGLPASAAPWAFVVVGQAARRVVMERSRHLIG